MSTRESLPLLLTVSETAALLRTTRKAVYVMICDEKGQPLTQKIVQVTIRRIARRAGVKPGVHILRHTFWSHLAMKGASKSDSRARWAPGPHDDAAVHASHTAALEAAIGLLNKPNPKRGETVEAAGNRA